ncbi:MAG TPA: alpha-glucosidase/alpha-galactosidase [Gaiellaceae bacterium]|nr:alpha-glucosidase/alpha-galactosidase [Gaiellaceae bacterium]
MPKVAFIGAGSTVFTKNLIGDLLGFPALRETTRFALMDIDPERLRTSEIVAHRVAEAVGAPAHVEATTDRRAALDGADYVVTTMQVGGYRPATVVDFEVPKRYGLRQTIADTLGVGGIMRGVRTIPVLLDVCRDIEELCPDALLLQYVNPMVMNCWAIAEATSVRTVGLCHSVQHTARQLANDLGVPPEELDYVCAGINHVAFYLRLEHRGDDLYPRLRRVLDEGRVPEWNRVRYELFRHFGAFVTESSEHFAEYCPWFIKDGRPDLIERFNVPLDEYLRRCEEQIDGWHELRERLERGEGVEVRPSAEYGGRIVNAIETGEPFTFNGNVPNRDSAGERLIDDFAAEAVVEVPCVAGADGVTPQRIGSLPPHLAALIRTNLNVHELAVRAVLDRNREHVHHAAMLDPHTAAELSLEEIRSLVDELLDAHGELVRL